ncbi:YbhB/YbcL family Raf kinase inhibitor-like protein [bacterium]|nr:YbhB/YbcL family Raf kinase inhibitor-like protein [bacterium]
MKIKSSSFENNQMIPSRYTCDGENISPDILIEQVPKESKSLVLIVDDPDAPMGTWVHWTLWNISPDIKEIAAGHVPEGSVQGMTSFGKPGYGGPCPPFGTHRYFFKIYAIDTILELGSNAGKAELEKAISGHILDKAQIVGLYKRK